MEIEWGAEGVWFQGDKEPRSGEDLEDSIEFKLREGWVDLQTASELHLLAYRLGVLPKREAA